MQKSIVQIINETVPKGIKFLVTLLSLGSLIYVCGNTTNVQASQNPTLSQNLNRENSLVGSQNNLNQISIISATITIDKSEYKLGEKVTFTGTVISDTSPDTEDNSYYNYYFDIHTPTQEVGTQCNYAQQTTCSRSLLLQEFGNYSARVLVTNGYGIRGWSE